MYSESAVWNHMPEKPSARLAGCRARCCNKREAAEDDGMGNTACANRWDWGARFAYSTMDVTARDRPSKRGSETFNRHKRNQRQPTAVRTVLPLCRMCRNGRMQTTCSMRWNCLRSGAACQQSTLSRVMPSATPTPRRSRSVVGDRSPSRRHHT